MKIKELGSLLVVGGAILIAYLKIRPFKGKKCNEAEQSTLAKVISKEVKQGTYNTGRSSGLGYSYTAKFRTSDGRELELFMCEAEFNGLNIGMKGKLTYKGNKIIKFREIVEEKKAEEVVENVVAEKECEEKVKNVRELTEDEAVELIR